MTKIRLSTLLLLIGFSGGLLAQGDYPAFEELDTNADGELSEEEAGAVEGLDFATWDANQDGVISREEYTEMAAE